MLTNILVYEKKGHDTPQITNSNSDIHEVINIFHAAAFCGKY